jgi:WD40 repeat protein/mono/diheme cytochrome c family protein
MRLFCFLLLVGGVLIAARADSSDTDFPRVAKIFAEHCLDCHAVQDPEGKLVLETYDLLMKGGESGPALVPGKSAESLLVKMIEGKFEKDGKTKFMPPGKREKLNAEQIAAIKGWIDAGAKPPAEGAVVAKQIVVPKITPKTPPPRAINSLAYEPKTKLLAVARIDAVEIVSAESQTLIRALPWPEGTVNAVAFSPDGASLFAAGGSVGLKGEFREWKVADGTLVRSVSAHTDSVYALAVSPDGKTLATGSYDQKIKLWHRESAAELRTLSGHNGCIYGLAFRADGKILASASADRTIKLWEVESGARRDTLSQPLKEQYTVAFSPDGKRLAAAGVDNRIRIWEISDDAKETTNPLLHSKFAHESAVLKVAFSSDGKSLVSSAEDKTLKLWESDSMKERLLLEPQPDWAAGLAFVLENKGIAAGRLDGSLAFYNAQNGSILPPARPELSKIEPRGIQRGVETKVKLTGKFLQQAASVKFGEPRLKAKVLSEPPATSTEAWIAIEPDSTLARGVYELTLAAANGETAPMKLYVDDLPQHIETESVAANVLSKIPMTVWGLHAESGDTDTYEFQVNSGQTIVFDAAARSIGSKANLVLSLVDANGLVLASNNQFDKSGDPFIAYSFTNAGPYRLVVSELVPGGSADHFYRVSIGAFPFVTALYPPIVPKGEAADIALLGHNLPPQARVALPAADTNQSDIPVKPDPDQFRWRGQLKVAATEKPRVLESEPNNSFKEATTLPAPGMAAGQIASGDTEDWFRFTAKAGQTWIIETAADRIGSPADTKIEIRDSAGKPIVRTLLQAVRDSAVTFRGIDSTTVDCRVENWEEMELNQYLYLQGEVVRLFRAPQGPDSGFNFYAMNGRRRNYFDTTATAHANAEPCYIVEAHPPGTKLGGNGLPVFQVFFENDDDAERKLGPDSKVYFTALADGEYFVRVTDTRGFGGDRFLYTLAVREAQPDFKISIDGMNPSVPKGSGQRFAVSAERIDGFEGEIKVELTGLPPGFVVSNPVTIQEGHTTAFGTLFANTDAPVLTAENCSTSKLTATAQIRGQNVTREAGTLGKITLKDSAPLLVELDPIGSAAPEITIAPGGSVPAMLKIRRNGHTELVTFQVENLPHGIIVDNIGLNGVLIPKDQNEREIFITAAKWVPETDRWCYAVSNEAGRQTSRPILVKVRNSAGQVARK